MVFPRKFIPSQPLNGVLETPNQKVYRLLFSVKLISIGILDSEIEKNASSIETDPGIEEHIT